MKTTFADAFCSGFIQNIATKVPEFEMSDADIRSTQNAYKKINPTDQSASWARKELDYSKHCIAKPKEDGRVAKHDFRLMRPLCDEYRPIFSARELTT